MVPVITAWKIACMMLGVGLILSALVLSGFERLERLGGRLCGLTISINRKSIRVATFAMIFSLTLAAMETLHLMNYQKTFDADFMIDQKRASRWRHERNWWLSVFNFGTWAVTWRASTVVKNLRDNSKRAPTAPRRD
eukprot:GHVO01019860.1.p1 GENE.GHVO01019860.1~~GHVO01019860.1.p1  ORF type:complete len:137 (-),score=13.87 GHVO01019860.1:91-501(-)